MLTYNFIHEHVVALIEEKNCEISCSDGIGTIFCFGSCASVLLSFNPILECSFRFLIAAELKSILLTAEYGTS